MAKIGIFGAGYVGLVTGACFADLGNEGYDVAHYDLDLTWHADQALLAGVATITARPDACTS